MNLNALVASLSDKEKLELLNILSSTNEDVITLSTTSPPKIAKDPNDFTMNSNSPVPKKKRRSAVKAGQNQWTDEGECRGKDVETPDIKPTPRNRKAPQKKTVTCSVCGSKTKILAHLVSGQYYRCEKCVG